MTEPAKTNPAHDGVLNGCEDGSSPRGDSLAWKREHFIPLRKSELVRVLAEEMQSEPQRESFLQLCSLLEATFHYEYHHCLEALKRLYAPFNPDSATRDLRVPTDEEREASVPELFERFTELLQRANYRHLSRPEIQQVVGIASDWGVRLEVDFARFEQLEVYVRGDTSERRTRKHWRAYYRPEEVEVPTYQRLVVIFRLCEQAAEDRNIDSRRVYIKMFKNIPKQDVDMLLPCTRFKMSMLDMGRVMLPTLSGLAIAGYKIFKGALLLMFAGFYGMLAFLGLVGGTVGYGIKSFLGYLRTKDKYQLTLTRSLYYQNLDNNAGVLFRVLDEAEEQEFREAILAYALLDRKARPDDWDADRLDREAEEYLGDLLGYPIDFEVQDALAKLERLGCAACDDRGHWRAATLSEALERLDRKWDNCFRYHASAEIADAAGTANTEK